MSLVVAIKKDGVVYLGADTRTTIGNTYQNSAEVNHFKIYELGDCFVGAAGDVSTSQILTERSEWFELNGKELTKKFIVQNIIPKYYDLVCERDRMQVEDKECDPPYCNASYIVTDGKRIFKINGRFEVNEMLTHAEIGCTKGIAFSVISNSDADADPDQTLLRALRQSSDRDKGVGAPYILVNTRDKIFKTVEE